MIKQIKVCDIILIIKSKTVHNMLKYLNRVATSREKRENLENSGNLDVG